MRNYAPSYLIESTRAKYATKLLRTFAVKSIEDFRARLTEYKPELTQLFRDGAFWGDFRPLEDFDPKTIGTR